MTDIELLDAALACIDASPESWDQAQPHRGTTASLAGHVVAQARGWPTDKLSDDLPWPSDVAAEAERWLGVYSWPSIWAAGNNRLSLRLHRDQLAGVPASQLDYLAHADLSCADLSYAYLAYANLTEATMAHACLAQAELYSARLTGANMTSATLTGARMRYAVLAHADLTNSRLVGADLTNANLTNANLTNANLTGADLTGADLTGVDLTGVGRDL